MVCADAGCAEQKLHYDFPAERVQTRLLPTLSMLVALHDDAELIIGPEKRIVRYHRGQMLVFGSRFVHGGSSYSSAHFRAFAYLSDHTFIPGNETDPYVADIMPIVEQPIQENVVPSTSRRKKRLRITSAVSYLGMEDDEAPCTQPKVSFFSIKLTASGWEWSNLEVAVDPTLRCEGLRVKHATRKGTGLPIFGCVPAHTCGTTHVWQYVSFGDVWPAQSTVCGCDRHATHKKVPAWGLGAWAKINESATPNCFIWANCIWLMDDVPGGTFLTVNYNITNVNRMVRGYHLSVGDEEAFQRCDVNTKTFLSKHKAKLFCATSQRFRGPLDWLRDKQRAGAVYHRVH